MDSLTTTKFFFCSFTNSRVHMNRINRLHIGMFIHNTTNRTEHIVHRFALILSAVCRNHNQAAICCPFKLGMSIVLTYSCFESINSSITGNINRAFILALFYKIRLGKFSRGKIVLRNNRYGLSVKLFGIRAINVLCTKPGFYMPHRNLFVEASKSSYKSGRSIPVNQHNIGFYFFQNITNSIKNVCCDVK